MMYNMAMYVCLSMMVILCIMQGGQANTVQETYRNLQDSSKVEQPREDNSDYKVVCYYSFDKPEYNGTLPPDLNVTACTHVIFFGCGIVDGVVQIDPSIVPLAAKIPFMKKMNPSLKVLCCNFGNFTAVLETEANQTRFAQSAAPVLRKYGFDGFDLDWEFPAYNPYWYLSGQKHNFTLITQALRREFEREAEGSSRPRLLLTAAVAGVCIIIPRSYEVDQLGKYLDFVNLMTYDTHYILPEFPFTGYNSPLHPSDSFFDKTVFKFFNTAWSANEWAKLGMNKSQIMVGVPFYGHAYHLIDASNHGLYSLAEGPDSEKAYFETCHIAQDPESHVVWDNSSLVPYLYRDKLWISYDNVESVTLKVQWTIQNKFGGTMVFSTNCDDYTGSCDSKTKWPLMTAVRRTMKKYLRK